ARMVSAREDHVGFGRVARSEPGEGDRLPAHATEWRPERRLVIRARFSHALKKPRTFRAVTCVDFADRRIEHLDCDVIFEGGAARGAVERGSSDHEMVKVSSSPSRVALRRTSFAGDRERRMVDGRRLELPTSALRTPRSPN